MEQEESVKGILDLLAPHLAVQNNGKSGSIVVMMCGVSGSSSYLLITDRGNIDQKRRW
jgi:hypothetical protein